MALVLINGTSTAGKTTIARRLSELGYETYDAERDGVSAWFNKQTGKRVAEFGEVTEPSAEWRAQNEWLIPTDWVTSMVAKSLVNKRPIILCGGSANEAEIRPMCGKVIWLKMSEAAIRERVNHPRDHDYGTRPNEVAKAIEVNARKEAAYAEYGATMVDATRPIDEVIEELVYIID